MNLQCILYTIPVFAIACCLLFHGVLLDRLYERVRLVEERQADVWGTLYYRAQLRLVGWGNPKFSKKLTLMAYGTAVHSNAILGKDADPIELVDKDLVADVIFASRKDAEKFGAALTWMCNNHPTIPIWSEVDLGVTYPQTDGFCADAVIDVFQGDVLIGDDGYPEVILSQKFLVGKLEEFLRGVGDDIIADPDVKSKVRRLAAFQRGSTLLVNWVNGFKGSKKKPDRAEYVAIVEIVDLFEEAASTEEFCPT